MVKKIWFEDSFDHDSMIITESFENSKSSKSENTLGDMCEICGENVPNILRHVDSVHPDDFDLYFRSNHKFKYTK